VRYSSRGGCGNGIGRRTHFSSAWRSANLFSDHPVVEAINSVRDLVTPLLTAGGLRARCARGGAALATGALVERGARLVRNIILARLLAPDQFGLMAIVLALPQLFEAMTEVGVRQAIIQNARGDTNAFLNVAWWLSAVRGAALCVCGIVAAPALATLYGNAALTPLSRVVFLTMLFSGVTSTRLYVLERRLQFARYVGITQGAGLAGTILTLLTAIFVRNVWALVIGFAAETVLRCVASFVIVPIRPRWKFDRRSSRELFAFARGMAGLPLLTVVVLQGDIFVLGAVCSKEQVGMYALTMALANIPVMVFSRVAQPLILPVLSSLQNNPQQLRSAVLRITRLLFTFGLPFSACLAAFGRPILALTYGQTYGAMASTFGLLCVHFLVYMVGTVLVSTYVAVGRPELQRRFLLAWVVVVVVFMYPAVHTFGPLGAAATLLIGLLFSGVLQLLCICGLLALPLRHLLATAKEGLVLAGAVALAAALLRGALPAPQFVQLGLAAGLCLTAWVISALRLRMVGRAASILAR